MWWATIALVGLACAPGAVASRWAVVVSKEASERGVGELLTAAMTAVDGIELVEREQLDAVVDELVLRKAFEPDGVDERMELCRLRRADYLLLVRTAQFDKHEALHVIACDSRCGARVAVSAYTFDPETIEATCTEIASTVGLTQARYPNGIERMVAVPPFVSKSLTTDFDRYQSQFAFILQGALTTLRGVAVLELEETTAIQREMQIGGGALQGVRAPIAVTGEFRGEQGEGGRKTFSLRLSVNDGAASDAERQFESVDAVSAFLRDDGPKLVFGEGSGAAERVLTPAQLSLLLEKRAETLAVFGDGRAAVGLLDAALFYAPNDASHVRGLVGRVRRQCRYSRCLSSSSVHAAATEVEWVELWRHCLDRVYGSWASGQFGSDEAFGIGEELKRDLYAIASSWRTASFGRAHDARMATLDEASSAYTRFFREVAPTLSKSLYWEPWCDAEDGREIICRTYLCRVGGSQREMDWRPVCDKECLELLVRELTTTFRDAERPTPYVFWLLNGFIASLKTSDLDGDALLNAAERLRDSSAVNQQYARFLEILIPFHACGDEGRPEARAVAQQLGELQADVAARVSEAAREPFCRMSQVIIAYVLKHGDEIKAERRLQPTVSPPSDDDASRWTSKRVRDEHIHMVVRDSQGEESYLESFAALEQKGYAETNGGPYAILATRDGFDVFWSDRTVWIHRTAGLLEPACELSEKGVRAVDWDGCFLWIALKDDGVVLWSLAQRAAVAQASLPPHDRGIHVCALSPGRAVLAGELNPQGRFWVAVAEWNGKTLDVDVIHEAIADSALAGGDNAYWFSKLDRHCARDLFGFVRTRDPYNAGAEMVLLDVPSLNRMLVVDPEHRRMRISSCAGLSGRGVLLPDGSSIRPSGDALRYLSPDLDVARKFVQQERSARHICRIENGADQKLRASGGVLYSQGGKRWRRVDPASLDAEELGLNPLYARSKDAVRVSATYAMRQGVSALFGPVVWDSRGKFFRILPEDTGESIDGDHCFIVVDAQTGEGLPDAVVECDDGLRIAKGVTDANGECVVDVTGAASNAAMARVDRKGYRSDFIVLRSAPDEPVNREHVMLLEPLMDVGGVVRDADGAPLADAVVVLKWEERARVATTDAAGRWTMSILERDLPGTEGYVVHRRYAKVLPHKLDCSDELTMQLATQTLEATLGAAPDVCGVLRDERGAPVSDAAVYYVPKYATSMDACTFLAKTGADGAFAVRLPSDALDDEYTLAIQPPDGLPFIRSVLRAEAERTQEIVLPSTPERRKRVRDEDGFPVAGAKVTLYLFDSPTVVLWEGETDEHGIVEPPPSEATMLISKEGYELTRLLSHVSIITLRRNDRLCIHGRVIDAATGAPIPEFEIWTNGRNRFYHGEFDLPVGRAVPKAYVFAPGYRPVEIQGKNVNADAMSKIQLASCPDIEARLMTPDGAPAAGAVVAARVDASASEAWCTLIRGGELRDSSIAWADAEGVFRMQPQPESFRFAAAHETGWCVFDEDQARREEPIALRPWRGATISFVGKLAPDVCTLQSLVDWPQKNQKRALNAAGSLRPIDGGVEWSLPHLDVDALTVELRLGREGCFTYLRGTADMTGGGGRDLVWPYEGTLLLGRIGHIRGTTSMGLWLTLAPVGTVTWRASPDERRRLEPEPLESLRVRLHYGCFAVAEIPPGEYRLSAKWGTAYRPVAVWRVTVAPPAADGAPTVTDVGELTLDMAESTSSDGGSD